MQLFAVLDGLVLTRELSYWWVALPITIVLAAGVFFVYLRESMKLDLARRIIMAFLRSLVIASIIFLLWKPVWEYPRSEEKVRPVLLLLDTSESMKQQDQRSDPIDQLRIAIAEGRIEAKNIDAILDSKDSEADKQRKILELYQDQESQFTSATPSRIDIVRSAFTNEKLRLLSRLKEKGSTLRVGTFDAEGLWTSLEEPKKDGSWAALNANKTKTALLAGIYQQLQAADNELPAAIVVVTDGLNNVIGYEDKEKRKPIDIYSLGSLCKKLQVPLHIYGVGGAASRLLHLKEIDSPSTLFVDDRARIRVAWRSRGVKTGQVQVDITLDGKVVATEKFPVKEGEHIEETLTFTPEKSHAAESAKQGKLNLSATVRFVDGPDKDTFSKQVRVVENKVKLLFVENAPRWEFKFLQRAFLRDRRVESSYIIVGGDKESMKAGKPFLATFPSTRELLFEYDLLFIGDVDMNYFTEQQQEWIHDFVVDGGGLVMVAGRQSAPASYFIPEAKRKHDAARRPPNNPPKYIADALPVEFVPHKFPIEDVKRPIEYKPVLSDVGTRSAMMSLGDTQEANERCWKTLPGWFWYYPTTKLKPAATALLEHPKQQNEDKRPLPLLAMQYYGRGLVMFAATDETWRWRWNDDNEADKFFSRFWGQVIYQVGLPRALGGRSQIAISGGEAVLGQPGKVYARLYTKDFHPLKSDRVAATVEWLDAPPNTPADVRNPIIYFEAVPNQPGEFAMTLPHNHQGKFVLKITEGESAKDTSPLEYRVTTPPGTENAPASLDEDFLSDLARESKGGYYREEELYRLPNRITPRSATYTPKNPAADKLWEKWWVLLTMVGLLTLEWLVRKFSNMS